MLLNEIFFWLQERKQFCNFLNYSNSKKIALLIWLFCKASTNDSKLLQFYNFQLIWKLRRIKEIYSNKNLGSLKLKWPPFKESWCTFALPIHLEFEIDKLFKRTKLYPSKSFEWYSFEINCTQVRRSPDYIL